jgi:hypothetical protein
MVTATTYFNQTDAYAINDKVFQATCIIETHFERQKILDPDLAAVDVAGRVQGALKELSASGTLKTPLTSEFINSAARLASLTARNDIKDDGTLKMHGVHMRHKIAIAVSMLVPVDGNLELALTKI